MNKINYKSDFDFMLPFPVCRVQTDGTCKPEDIGWPDFDWSARLWASSKSNVFVASRKGGELTNCYEDKGRIHIVCDNHRLGKGVLKVEIHAELPDGIYPDKVRDVFSPHSLGIELVDGPGDCATDIEAEYMLPYIKGPKGDKGDKGDPGSPLMYDDLTPEQIAALQRPAKEAAEKFGEFANEAEANEQERVEAERQREDTFAGFESAIGSKADRTELSNIYGEEPLTPGNFPDINTYTREELKKDLFIDLWNAAWGEYGGYDAKATDGHPFLGNGLRMTYEEAIEVMRYDPLCASGATSKSHILASSVVRTTTPVNCLLTGDGYQFMNLANGTGKLEIIRIKSDGVPRVIDVRYAFNGSTVREIIGEINVEHCSSANFTGMFFYCYRLREVRLSGLKYSLSLQWTKVISLESLAFMIAKAANTSAITITVHPTVYAKLTGDTTNDAYNDLTDEEKTQWTALVPLAAEKNITLATV